MMTQINKVFVIPILFSTAFREIEDLMHNWKVFFKLIDKDCLYFINKISIVVVIIRDETKNCVEYFHHRQQNIQQVGVVCSILYSNGNFGFHLAQGTVNFQQNPQEQALHLLSGILSWLSEN